MLRLVVGVVLLSLTAMNTVAQEGATGVLVFVEGSTVSSFSGSGGTWGGNMGGTTNHRGYEAVAPILSQCPHYRRPGSSGFSDLARAPGRRHVWREPQQHCRVRQG